MNNPKQLAIIGLGTAAVAKLYFKQDTRTSLIMGAVALLLTSLADNIAPNKTA